MNFIDAIQARWQQGTQVCIGLDPFVDRLPATEPSIAGFNRAIVAATGDIACCYKPQFAHYAAVAEEGALKATIGHIKATYPEVPVILDAKRNDIGSTAAMYAQEAFAHYGADAVTVNPYMGTDTVKPFADHSDKGVIVLCRTSNPSARQIQNLEVDGQPLYLHIARLAQEQWNEHGNICLVVGATAPAEMAAIRQVAPELPFLVPGIGAQGGDLAATVKAGQRQDGYGLMISSSRAILYASSGPDFAAAARQQAIVMRDEIQALMPQ